MMIAATTAHKVLMLVVATLCCVVIYGEIDVTCELSNGGIVTVNSSSGLTDVCIRQCSPVEEPEPAAKDENVGLAFGLVTAAGMSTTIGASLVFWDRFVTRTNRLVLAASLGFSGGVMIYVSLVEIFVKAVDEFTNCDCLWEHDDPSSPAVIMTTICFFIGIIIFMILDKCIHCLQHRIHKKQDEARRQGKEKRSQDFTDTSDETAQSPIPDGDTQLPLGDANSNIKICMCEDDQCGTSTVQRQISVEEGEQGETQRPNNFDLDGDLTEEEKTKKLHNMGILTAIAIGLHNLPEGLATFVATLSDPAVGAGLAVAIAIHNIPEGLCVSVPIYYATGSRWKGFWLAFFSGIAELVGAALGYAFLASVIGPATYAILFGVVAGMMVAIVLKELLPTAHRYDPRDKIATNSMLVGMAVMALSLCLFLI